MWVILVKNSDIQVMIPKLACMSIPSSLLSYMSEMASPRAPALLHLSAVHMHTHQQFLEELSFLYDHLEVKTIHHLATTTDGIPNEASRMLWK